VRGPAGGASAYRDWYELLRSRGLVVSGKEPVNTFLAQINRSASVERVGRRTGRYRVSAEVSPHPSTHLTSSTTPDSLSFLADAEEQ
jgi:hypothetical protein